MSDRKNPSFQPPLYHGDSPRNAPSRDMGSAKSEQKGWDAYRKWLSRVSAHPARERSSIDNSIYSWKGYNNWADRVKQSWKPEDTET